MCFCCFACFGTCVPLRFKIGLSGCWLVAVDYNFGWVSRMTIADSCASGWLDTEGPDVDAVGANGCGGGGSSAVGLGICFGLGRGGDDVGECLGDGSWICGGESSLRLENSWLIS